MNQLTNPKSKHMKEVLLSLIYLCSFSIKDNIEPKTLLKELEKEIPEQTLFFQELKEKYATRNMFYQRSVVSKIVSFCVIYEKLELLFNSFQSQFYVKSSERGPDFMIADLCPNEESILSLFDLFPTDIETKRQFKYISLAETFGAKEESEQLSNLPKKTKNQYLKKTLLNAALPKESLSIAFLRPKNNEIKYIQETLKRDVIAPNGKLIVIVDRAQSERCLLELIEKYKILTVSRTFDHQQSMIICENSSKTKNYSKFIKALKDYRTLQFSSTVFSFPLIDFENRLYEEECDLLDKSLISNSEDAAWQAFRDFTSIALTETSNSVVPKPLKLGELALFAAAGGKVNGPLAKEDGKGEHIVLGGVETVKTTEQKTSYSKSGEAFDSFVVTESSKPFLNILINNNGRYEIKKLREA